MALPLLPGKVFFDLCLSVCACHSPWGLGLGRSCLGVTLQPRHEVCQQSTISSGRKAGQYRRVVVQGIRSFCSPRSHKPQATSSSYVSKPPLWPYDVYAVWKPLFLFPRTTLNLTHCAYWKMTSLPRDTKSQGNHRCAAVAAEVQTGASVPGRVELGAVTCL